MKLRLILIMLAAFVSAISAQVPSASPTPPVESDDQIIKVNTLLVNIPVIASDRNGRYSVGLTRENFLITEDGEKRAVEFFADEKAPMNVAILIDCSGSISPFIRDFKEAARDFVKIIRPEDRVLIAGFDDEMYIFSEFTGDQKQLRKAIDKTSISSNPGSNMQDSINALLSRQFASVKGRKAIVVLTDGMVGGHISNEKLLSILAESDVLIYPILFERERLPTPTDYPDKVKTRSGEVLSRQQIEERWGSFNRNKIMFMTSLATVTGGRFYDRKSGNFKKIFQNVADELKNQYLVGFYPQNTEDGKNHKIAVEVNLKNVVIRTKRRIQLKLLN